MAKKSRRKNTSKNKTVLKIKIPPVEAQQEADSKALSFVVADLKRMGILSSALFVLLIALSFFIR